LILAQMAGHPVRVVIVPRRLPGERARQAQHGVVCVVCWLMRRRRGHGC